MMPSFKRAVSVGVASVGGSLLLLGSALARDAAMAQTASAFALAGPPTLTTTGLAHLGRRQLANIRGGFSLPGGVKINFGFVLQTFSDGKPVQNIAQSVSHLTPTFVASGDRAGGVASSADQTAPGRTTQTVSDQGIGTTTKTGTTFKTTIPGPTGTSTSTLIQNTLSSSGVLTHIDNNVNNRAIQIVRTYNIDITGLKTQIQDGAAISHLVGSLTPR